MRGKQDLKDQGPICSTAGAGPFMPQAIFRRDLNDIERADVVLFDVRGAKDKSLGSIFELGYAYARGKYIILLTDGERGNPHEHLFVDCAVDIQFADEEQLLDYLTEMGGYW
jgi:nucleoside 2-deoxyribosyltransferase